VILFPCSVQGVSAPAEIVSAIKAADKHPAVDVILVVRGGGSFEDLYCFNDERVVRAVANATKPVVSGVGHETDRTLIDDVADYAAHTPTAAALAATPDLGQASIFLDTEAERLSEKVRNTLVDYAQTIDNLSATLIEKAYQKLNQQTFELDLTQDNLQRMARARLLASQNELENISARLQGIDPKATLARGFSITTLNGKPVISSADLPVGAEILTTFASGTALSTVTQAA
jgi:exodeoxyribonuclease VII large subunit